MSLPGAWRAGLVVFLLAADFALNAAFILGGVAAYVGAESTKRISPLSTRRATSLALIVAVTFLLSISVMQVLLGHLYAGSSLVKHTMLFFGFLWAAVAVGGLNEQSKLIWRRWKLKSLVPDFSGVRTAPRGIVFAWMLIVPPMTALSVVGLVTELHVLRQTPLGWLTPLRAAIYSLLFLAVGFVLFGRFLNKHPRSVYYELERAILLENLTPAEIKHRFITHLLGPSLGEWVSSFNDDVEKAVESLKVTVDSIERRAADVETIESKFKIERGGRAKILFDELVEAVKRFDALLDTFIVSREEYLKATAFGEETEYKKQTLVEWKSQNERMKAQTAATRVLSERLSALMAEGP
jgi:hypothetical protein